MGAYSRLAGTIRSFRTDSGRRALAENWFSLTFLQYANYLFPLLLIPYLTRVIGVRNFGRIAFAQAFVSFIVMLVNYGFPYSATRQIAITRDDPQELRKILSQVIWSKLFLAGLGLLPMLLFVGFVSKYRSERELFIVCYSLVVGNVFACEWFFQGMEKMKYITIVNLLSGMVATLLVFAVVRRPENFLWVPALTASGVIVGNGLGFFLIKKHFGISIQRPSMDGIKRQLKEGFNIFVSSAFISLYTTANAFLLGLITNPTQVGYYSAAEKTTNGLRSLWGPVPQVLYPRFSRLFSSNPERGKNRLRLVLALTTICTLLISLLGVIAAPQIVRYYLGSGFRESQLVIQVLSFTVLATGINNVLGVQGLLANGLSKVFRNIVCLSAVVNIVLLIPFVKTWGVIGPAISVVAVEFLICTTQWIVLRKKRLI